MKKIIVTGSSGYVASHLIPCFKNATLFGVDKTPSKYCDLEAGIESNKFKEFMQKFHDDEITIINLAASRLDFGISAKEYFNLNVKCHKKFLKNLCNSNVKKFIHISSVAALDGKNISYSDNLNCDDAYRATKYIQETLIENWCDINNIELTILYPSAIFSNDIRSDTNIGKLQSISQYIPFIPKIDNFKSLTYLPKFSQFIFDSAFNNIKPGRYLTIEKPILTVSKMMQIISGRSIRAVNIPFLPIILKGIANILFVLSFFGKIDVKITPNRVKKLFSDTSYSNINYKDIDIRTYSSSNYEDLAEILSRLN